jgi:citrate lyase subunit beta/citryl-CoA lyase/(S)-citramalyl-CoA lyase
MAYRSLLFVPGSRPDRFDKAAGAGADAVCIDLEDAVPPDGKDAARAAAIAALNGGFGVRVNAVGTADGETDLKALSDARPVFVMIPKAASAAEVAAVRAATDAPLWPIVESAEGLHAAWDIAAAPGVAGVLFGGADYAADLGCTMEWEPLFHARGVLAAACARAGVELLDVPHLDINDEADLTTSTRRIKAMGFTGRACIHPSQIAPVHAVFTPTEAEIARARRVLDAFQAADGGAALLDGKLIEKPLIRAARRTLEHVGDA